MSLALVQAGVSPALHIGVEQPVNDEERSFDSSDFAEGDGQFVLAMFYLSVIRLSRQAQRCP